MQTIDWEKKSWVCRKCVELIGVKSIKTNPNWKRKNNGKRMKVSQMKPNGVRRKKMGGHEFEKPKKTPID